MSRLPGLLPALLVLSACAGLQRPPLVTAPREPARLAAAAERFYGATTPAELTAAVEEARQAAPTSALHHELAARLAQLEARDGDVITHLLLALQDLGDDAALAHLHRLMSMDFSASERARVEGLLAALSEGHPDEAVRALASHHLAALFNQEARPSARDEALARIPGRLAFAVVGTWDNDQGKGFDLELPPERTPGLDQQYEGRSLKLTWRRGVPEDPRGRLDLGALMSPARWVVAFAQASFTVPEGQAGAVLQLMSSDPLKVWVDGRPVFSASQLERPLWDQLSLPVSLKPGAHTVLIKSAHREATWLLAGRVTFPASTPAPVTSLDDIIQARVAALSTSPLRRAAQAWEWATLAAGGTLPVKLADAWVRVAPRSVVARASLADALWFNQERGRAADLLQSLDAELGDALTMVRLRQVRFQQQQGLREKARTRLLQLVQQHPEAREAWQLLADGHREESWREDELQVRTEAARRFEPTDDETLELARTHLRAGRRAEAVALIRQVLDQLPATGTALRLLADLELDAGHLTAAAALYQRRLASWPTDFSALLQLAECQRRQGDVKAAHATLDAATALSPQASLPFVKRGELAWAQGGREEALTQWRQALELNPENDAVAGRIDFLAPAARGPWMADVPDEAALEKTVRLRETLRQQPGADVAWLLDHEVTLLNSDGSTSNVITHVVHAFNAQGRDRIIRQSLGGGRLKVLHAWSVDEKGVRSEASSERGRQIFFRAMQPGSTLVLQYRTDVPPRGFLSRFWTEQWSFQGPGEQRVESTFVLWTPKDTVVHERRVGEVHRRLEPRGEQQRFQWSRRDVPPITWEPNAPGGRELAANVSLSTVPDWGTWLSWERALLDGVFRDGPELDALARRLGEGAATPDEKLRRIFQFVMEEIRYQQDYETFIAGVKPHAAPMVLERRYGDCKDKAVLFIALARKLDLDAQFALVRTRDAGPVEEDVPSQQFNHAIVYVPEQPGVTARFYDPTADLLDLDAVRHDDVGTRSLVFDPRTQSHTWRDIPWQAPEVNAETGRFTLTLAADGTAEGTAVAEGTGRFGSTLRQLARNSEVMGQVLQRSVATVLSGATVSDAKVVQTALTQPAVLSMGVAVPALARREGDELRLRLPADVSPRRLFGLSTRKYPLVLGTPTRTQTQVELTLPAGYAVARLPEPAHLELPCLALDREVTQSAGVVRATTRLTTRCERVAALDYPAYRAQAEEMGRVLEQELVLKKEPAAPRAR